MGLDRRLELHERLVEILGTSGQTETRVYFQPPATIRMKYPAIVYEKDGGWVLRADNKRYRGTQRYSVTVVDPDPDSEIAERILKAFSMCSYDRNFVSDNLNHDVLTLYF